MGVIVLGLLCRFGPKCCYKCCPCFTKCPCWKNRDDPDAEYDEDEQAEVQNNATAVQTNQMQEATVPQAPGFPQYNQPDGISSQPQVIDPNQTAAAYAQPQTVTTMPGYVQPQIPVYPQQQYQPQMPVYPQQQYQPAMTPQYGVPQGYPQNGIQSNPYGVPQ